MICSYIYTLVPAPNRLSLEEQGARACAAPQVAVAPAAADAAALQRLFCGGSLHVASSPARTWSRSGPDTPHSGRIKGTPAPAAAFSMNPLHTSRMSPAGKRAGHGKCISVFACV